MEAGDGCLTSIGRDPGRDRQRVAALTGKGVSAMSDALKVRELIQEADLGLELVSAEGLERVIRGIHLSDLEDPTPFMIPGMVLLTTGETFASSPSVGVCLLDRLAKLDCAALGVGVGHYFDHVHPQMLARAAELGVPVFEAPITVPFRIITSYVYNALASADMHRLRRCVAIQGHLLDLMLELPGVDRLVAELATILQADVMLFDSGGAVVGRAGTGRMGSEQDVWTRVKAHEGSVGPLGVLENGWGRLYIRRVVVHGMLERVLVAATSGSSSAEFVDTALSFAQRLLIMERLQEGEQVIVHRRMRSLLLDDFLAGRGSGDDFLPRLQEQDLTLADPWRVAVFNIDGLGREIGRRRLSEKGIHEIKGTFIDSLDKFFGEQEIPFLSSVQGDSVVTLLVVGERDPECVAALLSDARNAAEHALASREISVGCSAVAVGPEGGSRRMRDAMEALQMAKEGCGITSRVVLFDVAGGRFRLVEGQSVAALDALYLRLVKPLEDYDQVHRTSLVMTLRTYVDNCLSPSRTADALIIHRSTLSKRLRRIESLLGVGLGRMDDVVELHLALRAAELLRAQDRDPR
jgi:PucR family transcriptional regulator, purine catabolism regulatory protein